MNIVDLLRSLQAEIELEENENIKLTSEIEVDNLRKFAKTSHATEALLAESKQGQKREQKVSSKYR